MPSADQPADQPADQTADRTADRATDRAADRTTDRTTDRADDRQRLRRSGQPTGAKEPLAAGRHDEIALAVADPRSDGARACLARYYAELARRFDTGFEVHLSRDPEAADMMAPRGVFLLALSNGVPIGCAGLKGHTTGTPGRPAESWGEVKRVWVDPAARGRKLATRLMDEIETRARALGFAVLRLDTNSALPEARALYERLGWRRIERFNDDPYPDMFFEKRL